MEYEHEEEEEEDDDKETVKRGLRKRAKSYSHYEIFGSEEDDDDDDEDDADDEDASDDCGRKGVKTRGAKRSGSDESDILRKTRRLDVLTNLRNGFKQLVRVHVSSY